MSFNSRTPGGVRRLSKLTLLQTLSFNSRTPGGVRQLSQERMEREGGFQFTHPGRGATHYGVDVPSGRGVSIHAPREGCDWTIIVTKLTPLTFQFTHPGRGATLNL